MPAVTIKLFLPTGEPQRLRIAEIPNWSGKAIAAPRTELDTLLKQKDLEGPGVYVLVDTAKDTGLPAAYIGEGEAVGDRLSSHSDKDWVQAIVFVSQSDNLTKAHIRYLEGKLIEEVKLVGRFTLKNAVASGAKLPASDREDMNAFLDRVRLLLPVLGCDLLEPVAQPARGGASQNLICTIKSLIAHGQRSPQGFVVLKGSGAAPQLRKSACARAPWLISLREKLVNSKVLLEEGGRLRFAQDYEFSSPSTAAAVIHGGHANGLTAWKTSDGKTLKELEATLQPD